MARTMACLGVPLCPDLMRQRAAAAVPFQVRKSLEVYASPEMPLRYSLIMDASTDTQVPLAW